MYQRIMKPCRRKGDEVSVHENAGHEVRHRRRAANEEPAAAQCRKETMQDGLRRHQVFEHVQYDDGIIVAAGDIDVRLRCRPAGNWNTNSVAAYVDRRAR